VQLLHIVSHIEPEKRVKSFVYHRDLEKEERIKNKCEQLKEYYSKIKKELGL